MVRYDLKTPRRFNFLTTVFMVRNVTLCDCGLLVEGKMGLIKLVVVLSAHTKLYSTKDIVDDSFVPRNPRPKPIPKPEAKPALKAA